MAIVTNEVNIRPGQPPGQPATNPFQSLADLGTIQVNLVVKSIEALTPVAGSLAKTMTDILSASVNMLGAATGAAAGVVASAGGTILQAAGAIAVVPVKVIGSLAGALASTAQSGIALVLNAIGSVLPGRKPA